MSDLFNKAPADTVGDLLHLDNNNQGANASEVVKLKDGKGNELPVEFSQDKVNFLVDPSVNGVALKAGLDGADGADGVNGTNGVDGKSAYQIWLDAGNAGTEQDFLESLKASGGSGGDASPYMGIVKGTRITTLYDTETNAFVSSTFPANNLYFQPYYSPQNYTYKKVGFRAMNLSHVRTMRFGLFSLDFEQAKFDLIQDLGTIYTNQGIYEYELDINVLIPKGVFYIGIISDGTISVACSNDVTNTNIFHGCHNHTTGTSIFVASLQYGDAVNGFKAEYTANDFTGGDLIRAFIERD